MDPFSVTVGIVSTLDVCTRTASFLKGIKKGASTVDKEVEAISNDVEAVKAAVAVLNNVYNSGSEDGPSGLFTKNQTSQAWRNLMRLLPKCEDTITKIQELIQEISDFRLPKSAQRLEGLIKTLRKHSRETEYYALRRELGSYIVTLQMLLSAIQA